MSLAEDEARGLPSYLEALAEVDLSDGDEVGRLRAERARSLAREDDEPSRARPARLGTPRPPWRRSLVTFALAGSFVVSLVVWAEATRSQRARRERPRPSSRAPGRGAEGGSADSSPALVRSSAALVSSSAALRSSSAALPDSSRPGSSPSAPAPEGRR